MIKILIVEDETIVALDTKSSLKKLGYEVTDMVTNYDETMESLKCNKPDIILMDIFLKNSINGIEISKKINKKYNIPIIFLSAFCDDETIANAVEVEPVGYLVKPFNRNELKTTIKLVSYKLQKKSLSNFDGKLKITSNYYYSLNDYFRIYYLDQEIPLTKNERLFLEILITAKGELVSFSALEHFIWVDKSVSDSTLRTLIYRLRNKFDHKLIESISSLGCRLNIEL